MSDDSSGIVSLLLGFVAIVFLLAVFAPQYIPLATNVFVFLFVDHIEGLVAGALVGVVLGALAARGEGGIEIFGFTISFVAIAGTVVQYLLFH